MFPFSPPSLITPELSSATFEQMYVADLGDGTLQLATLGYDGQAASGAVVSPSFSANDGPIAFSSSATNLVYGAFSDLPASSEVFTTTEEKPPAIPGLQQISPPPANPLLAPDWLISASVSHGRNGAAVVAVTVPSAGRLSAVARAAVPVDRSRRADGTPAEGLKASRAGAGRDAHDRPQVGRRGRSRHGVSHAPPARVVPLVVGENSRAVHDDHCDVRRGREAAAE